MVKINELLQNLGYKPNKEMSTYSNTVYDIDSFGKETISDNLVIDNKTEQRWTDKANNTHGNLFNLITNLGRAYNYGGAVAYAKNFPVMIRPWSSDREERSLDSDSILEYKSEVRERIYKLQTFALMSRAFFDDKYYGYFYLKNFNLDDFIDNQEFRDYYKEKHDKEMDMIIDNPSEIQEVKNHYVYAENARTHKYPELPMARISRVMVKSIKQMMQEQEDKWQAELYQIEKDGGDVQAYIKEELESIKKEIFNE